MIGTYVIVITQNITVPYWNPSPPQNAIPLVLTYPESLVPNFPSTGFAVNMLLAFSGTLAENTVIEPENATCQTFSTFDMNISYVVVGFQEAYPLNITGAIEAGKQWAGGGICAVFIHLQDYPNSTNPYLEFYEPYAPYTILHFPIAGDYSPSVFITFDNGSLPVQYTYNEIKVHVLSASEVTAQNINRVNLGLTFAVLAFSFIGGFMVIHELLKKEETTNKPEQPKDKTDKNINDSGKTKTTDASQERKLQIRLGQLNADLQVYLAAIFGAIATAVAMLVFGYQLALESGSKLSVWTIIAIAFFAAAGYISYRAYRTLSRLRTCLDEFKNLQ